MGTLTKPLTGAEIKALYEAEANAFTDTKNTKLAGIENGAKDDQSGAEIKTAYEAEANAFTDTKNTKLAGIENGAKDDQSLSEVPIDANLAMGAHNITLGAGQTVDGKDISGMVGNVDNVVAGTYTGDGTVSKAIDTGFTTLKGVYISLNSSGTGKAIIKLAQDTVGYSRIVDSGVRNTSMFAEAFSGGVFTVDDNGADSFPNTNGIEYFYLAWGV